MHSPSPFSVEHGSTNFVAISMSFLDLWRVHGLLPRAPSVAGPSVDMPGSAVCRDPPNRRLRPSPSYRRARAVGVVVSASANHPVSRSAPPSPPVCTLVTEPQKTQDQGSRHPSGFRTTGGLPCRFPETSVCQPRTWVWTVMVTTVTTGHQGATTRSQRGGGLPLPHQGNPSLVPR